MKKIFALLMVAGSLSFFACGGEKPAETPADTTAVAPAEAPVEAPVEPAAADTTAAAATDTTKK